MNADPFQIGNVLKDPKRFVVPIYQRTYAWRIDPHLEAFFEQVAAKAEERLAGNDRFPHYMGAILVIPRGKYTFGRMTVLDVVDGQQRLTTFQLFLAVLRHVANGIGETDIADVLTPLLTNAGPQVKERLEQYKLQPTKYDQKLYFDLVDQDFDKLRREYSSSFHANGKVKESAELLLRGYGFLKLEVERFIQTPEGAAPGERLRALSAALLEGFQIIMITLDEGDDAQVIFETLNAGGEPLAAMDLVRNDVFHRAVSNGEDVELLMERRWQTFESPFWKQSTSRGRLKKPRIDFFLSDTLAAEGGGETSSDLYARYRRFVSQQGFRSVDAELGTLLKHAPTFQALVVPATDTGLGWLGRQLEIFDVSTAYPLAFVIADSDAPESDKSRLYQLIVSYVVRRLICGLTSKNYNNVFLRILGQLRERGVSYEEGRSAFYALDAVTVRFPSDEEFRDAIRSRRQYGNMAQPRLKHILSELEHASLDKFDETVAIRDDLTVEHILPEAWAENWPLSDGTRVPSDLINGMNEAQLSEIRSREHLKHTLGNLTLLTPALNPSLGNGSFAAKREKLKASQLRMNLDIANKLNWNEDSILSRADQLATLAIRQWPSAGPRDEGK